MAKIISKKIVNTIKYGVITIETSQGTVDFEYSTGVDYDTDYKPRSGSDRVVMGLLRDREQDEVDDIICNEINK